MGFPGAPPPLPPIEVRGALTEAEHLAALRVVRSRLDQRWMAPAICLGGPALIVALTMAGGMSFGHAVFVNLFWIVLGPLVLFVGLPLGARSTIRSWRKANPAVAAPDLYRFTETGFETRGGPIEVSIAWPAVTEALETEKVLLLFIGHTMAYPVPRAAIVAAGRLEAVRGILREHLGERAAISIGRR